jgi:hypothetical protein
MAITRDVGRRRDDGDLISVISVISGKVFRCGDDGDEGDLIRTIGVHPRSGS